jgi:hypothetical protein
MDSYSQPNTTGQARYATQRFVTRQPENPPNRVLQIPVEPGPLPEALEVSALVREFAQPLVYAEPAGPADLEALRTSLMLAMICWNLPVYEATGSSLFAKGTRTLSEISKNVPRRVGAALQQLLVTRKSKFADRAYLVLVEVEGTTLADATIIAQAKHPKRLPSA